MNLKKCFIDCGANIGQSIENFQKRWHDWKEYEIHSFEANPNLSKHFEKFKTNSNFYFYEKAIFISDNGVDLYLSTESLLGSSVLSNKKTGKLSKTPIFVESIDFSRWVISKFSKYDYVIVKMDIEGAEYQVVDKMIKDRAFDCISEFFIEFHSHKIGLSKNDDQNILDRLKEFKTIVHVSRGEYRDKKNLTKSFFHLSSNN